MNATEASPAANTYVNANFTSSYFSSLSHTLPASLYYNAAPSWSRPSGKNWPPIGAGIYRGGTSGCAVLEAPMLEHRQRHRVSVREAHDFRLGQAM